ncbi:MAG: phage portal protein [Rhodospirillales bacterium]|nr:phage portal protein [Rhodospirillales bacterium]
MRNRLGRDTDYADPERINRLTAYNQVLDGTIYDALPFDFHQERDGDKYVPLRDRAPSVRFNLCRTVVQDSVSLLFGEGRFPALLSDGASQEFAACVAATKLESVMVEAAMIGSVGSVALHMRILEGRVFYVPMATTYLAPVFADAEPDRLIGVTELYKVKGRDLQRIGYDIAEDAINSMHWFRRTWDEDQEGWYIPVPVNQPGVRPEAMQVDADRTVQHGLGICPFVWIKNLPPSKGIDGQCTFAAAIDAQIEIEYQLSQAGRGLKYSSDPTLVIKEPAAPEGDFVKSAGNALVVSEKGDAKLLEIGGTASQAVVDYVKALRELALETVHGHRAAADKVSAAQSGRAIELSFQGLVWLADKLRTSYGAGLLAAVNLARKAAQTGRIKLLDADGKPLAMPDGELTLQWGPFFPPTHQDRQSDATALTTLIRDEVISRKTSTGLIARTYDIPDIDAERALIEAEQAAQMKRAQEMAAQVKLNETGEA